MSKLGDEDFSREYQTFTNISQTDFVPETYDALIVAAEVMARFIAYPKKSPMNAAMTVLTNGAGTSLPRTKEGFQIGFDQILKGQIPIFSGATGPLTFVPEGTDRLTPLYGIYRIEEGRVVPDGIDYKKLTKSDPEHGLSIDQFNQSTSFSQNFSSDNFRAVIVAFSKDWINYRHQADALTVYDFVKEQGVPDDHIILLVYDDIPEDQRNKKPGEVYHTPGEMEVRKRASPDYIGDMVNKQMFRGILTGTGYTKDVRHLQSDENSTVLLYLSSHSTPEGSLIIGNGKEQISPEEFSSLIEDMTRKQKFGRMLIILESCYSEATAHQVKSPGVVVMSAASLNETSKSAIFDGELDTWLSDEFTAQLIANIRNADRTTSLRSLYQDVYHDVRSSHPRITYDSPLLDIPALTFFGGI